MAHEDHHYKMLGKALIWGAALFLATLGWFMPPGNTHYLFIEPGTRQVRAIDTISASGEVVPPGVAVGAEVIKQSKDKGIALIAGAALVSLVWGVIVVHLNLRRSVESRTLFPSYGAVFGIVAAGCVAYLWFILNIADVLPSFLAGDG